MAAETWQVIVTSIAEVLVEVEAETKEQAERYAVEAAAEADQSRWEHRFSLTADNAWRKATHNATCVDEQPWDEPVRSE